MEIEGLDGDPSEYAEAADAFVRSKGRFREQSPYQTNFLMPQMHRGLNPDYVPPLVSQRDESDLRTAVIMLTLSLILALGSVLTQERGVGITTPMLPIDVQRSLISRQLMPSLALVCLLSENFVAYQPVCIAMVFS